MAHDPIRSVPVSFAEVAEDKAGARVFAEKFTKLAGEDNLIGSAGEFGLLFAFLARKPGAKKINGEAAISLADVHTMFIEKHFPDGWQTWKKTEGDWVKDTAAIAVAAEKAYRFST